MSDPAVHTDGLAALQARRANRTPKRTIPKSQNPTDLPPYKAPEVVDLNTEESTRAAPEEAQPPRSAPSAGNPPAPAQAVKVPSRKVGLYLEEPHEDFLEAVRVAGNALRPKVNLSASAVVRLAIDRLMARLSPEEVRDALVAKPVDPAAPGRPRR